MAQDSDDLYIVSLYVWFVVLVLAIVTLLCPPSRRVVRWCTIWCNKCVISLLKLIFISHLNHLFRGDASTLFILVYNLFNNCLLESQILHWSYFVSTLYKVVLKFLEFGYMIFKIYELKVKRSTKFLYTWSESIWKSIVKFSICELREGMQKE